MDVSPEARVELERMERSSVLPHRKVVQATALLGLADGASLRSTARLLRTYPNTVAAWRDRFIEAGVAGVGVIAPGRGRKREIPAATVEAIVHDTLHTAPDDGSACWSTRTLGDRHDVGKDTVPRIWKARNLRPWQVDTFKLSNDPNFEAKLVDVVGLYMDPPERAVVFSFDEKIQCQALDRTQPSLPIKPGRGRTMTHDYKRNGTIDLFAAMNIATGKCSTTPAAPTPAPTSSRSSSGSISTSSGTWTCMSCWTICRRTSPNPCAAGSLIRNEAVTSALHPDQRVVAEPDRGLVLGHHPQGVDEHQLHLDRPARRCDRRVGITLERRPATVRVDQDRRGHHH